MYLVDTNICIFYMKGKFNLDRKFDSISYENIFISEITLAELKYGVEKSENLSKNKKVLDDFDLLIGSTSIAHNLIMVTNNTKHMERIKGIQLEDWTK